MSATLGEATYLVSLDTAPFTTGLKTAETSAAEAETAIAGSMARIGKSMTLAATVPLIGIGADSIKQFVDFQSEMTKLQTQAGASKGEVDKLTVSVEKLAQTSPQGPTTLAEGLYHLISIGMGASTAMTALSDAVNLAAVGGSNLEDTTSALGAVWKNQIPGAQSLAAATGAINAAVGLGNMRMSDMVGALQTGVIPAFKMAGLTFQDFAAGLDIMTDAGVPANLAATRLRMGLALIVAPSKLAASVLQSMGMSEEQLAVAHDKLGTSFQQIGLNAADLATAMLKPDGLVNAMLMLRQHIDDAKLSAVRAEELIYKSFGGGRTGQAIVQLYNQIGLLQLKFDANLALQQDWATKVAEYHQTAAYKIHTAWSNVDVAMIKMGGDLTPIAVDFLGLVKESAQWFTSLSDNQREAIEFGGAIVAAIGPGLVIISKLIGLWSMAANGIRALLGLQAEEGVSAQQMAQAQLLATQEIVAALDRVNETLLTVSEQATLTATALGKIGLAFVADVPEASTAGEQMVLELGDIQHQATLTATAIESIGLAMDTDLTEMTTATAAIDGQLSLMGDTAAATATEMEGIGTAADLAMGPIGLLAAAVGAVALGVTGGSTGGFGGGQKGHLPKGARVYQTPDGYDMQLANGTIQQLPNTFGIGQKMFEMYQESQTPQGKKQAALDAIAARASQLPSMGSLVYRDGKWYSKESHLEGSRAASRGVTTYTPVSAADLKTIYAAAGMPVPTPPGSPKGWSPLSVLTGKDGLPNFVTTLQTQQADARAQKAALEKAATDPHNPLFWVTKTPQEIAKLPLDLLVNSSMSLDKQASIITAMNNKLNATGHWSLEDQRVFGLLMGAAQTGHRPPSYHAMVDDAIYGGAGGTGVGISAAKVLNETIPKLVLALAKAKLSGNPQAIGAAVSAENAWIMGNAGHFDLTTQANLDALMERNNAAVITAQNKAFTAGNVSATRQIPKSIREAIASAAAHGTPAEQIKALQAENNWINDHLVGSANAVSLNNQLTANQSKIFDLQTRGVKTLEAKYVQPALLAAQIARYTGLNQTGPEAHALQAQINWLLKAGVGRRNLTSKQIEFFSQEGYFSELGTDRTQLRELEGTSKRPTVNTLAGIKAFVNAHKNALTGLASESVYETADRDLTKLLKSPDIGNQRATIDALLDKYKLAATNPAQRLAEIELASKRGAANLAAHIVVGTGLPSKSARQSDIDLQETLVKWLQKIVDEPRKELNDIARKKAYTDLSAARTTLDKLLKEAYAQTILSEQQAEDFLQLRGQFFNDFASNIFGQNAEGKLTIGGESNMHVTQHLTLHQVEDVKKTATWVGQAAKHAMSSM